MWTIEFAGAGFHAETEFVMENPLPAAIKRSKENPDKPVSVGMDARIRCYLLNGEIDKEWPDYSRTYIVEERDEYISAIVWNEYLPYEEWMDYADRTSEGTAWDKFTTEELKARFEANKENPTCLSHY